MMFRFVHQFKIIVRNQSIFDILLIIDYIYYCHFLQGQYRGENNLCNDKRARVGRTTDCWPTNNPPPPQFGCANVRRDTQFGSTIVQ